MSKKSQSLIFAAFCLLMSLPASAGPRDGGGGDIRENGATAAQVRREFNMLGYNFLGPAQNLQRTDTNFIQDAELREVVADLSQSSKFLMIANSAKLELTKNGPCYDGSGVESDGSVDAFESGSTICMSLPRLMSHSSEALRTDMLALFAHEIVHQAGYGEAAARKFQSYFVRELVPGFPALRREIWYKVDEMKARINVQLCTILVPQQKCSSASWTIDNEGLKSVSEEYWSAYGLDHSMLGSLEKQLDVEWSNFQKIYNGPCSGQACIGRYKDLIEASQKNADVAEQILKTISDSM